MLVGQEKFGMQTMNQSLASLYQRRLISLDTATARSSDPDELRSIISKGAGAALQAPGRMAAGSGGKTS